MKKILVYAIVVMVIIGFRERELAVETQAVVSNEDLWTAVEQYITEFEMTPAEPRLDPVWHFVPGLYGVEFDFTMSYQNMLTNGYFDASLMVGNSVAYEGCSSEFRQHRIYRGHEQSPYVALLINVAWGGPELMQMLDILEEYSVFASVFFEGKYADKNPELVQNVWQRGHLIGNHSYSHPANWLNLSYDGFSEEIRLTNDVLRIITGEEMIFFAPPGGAFNEDTIQAAYNQGMYTILWSADSIDWRGEPANVLVNRVMRRITPGGLILTHPKPETVIALPQIITQIREQGLEFRRIDEIVSGTRSDYFSQ